MLFLFLAGQHVVGGEAAFVAPLVGVNVVERGRVLLAVGQFPVRGEGDGAPRGLVGELLLADVVRQPAAVDAHGAGQHQRDDGRAVEQVVVIPVVGPRADDHHVLAARLLRVEDPLPGIAEAGVAVDAGVLLLPGRGVARLVIVGRGIVAGEAAAHAELRHHQIEDGRHGDRAGVGLDRAHGHAPQTRRAAGEIVERNLDDPVVRIEEGQFGIEVFVRHAVLHFEIPFALLGLPAEADRALGHARAGGGLIPDQQLPVAVLLVGVGREPVGAQVLAGRVATRRAGTSDVLGTSGRGRSRPGRAGRCTA